MTRRPGPAGTNGRPPGAPSLPVREDRSGAPAVGARPRDLDALAQALDARFRVPGTGIRFGLDAVLGLIPGAGDWIGALLALYFVGRGAAAGAPASVLARMVGNTLVDLAVGLVPVAGDLADVAWKANLRNARLLGDWMTRPERVHRRSRLVVLAVLLGTALLFTALLALGLLLLVWIASRIAG